MKAGAVEDLRGGTNDVNRVNNPGKNLRQSTVSLISTKKESYGGYSTGLFGRGEYELNKAQTTFRKFHEISYRQVVLCLGSLGLSSRGEQHMDPRGPREKTRESMSETSLPQGVVDIQQ